MKKGLKITLSIATFCLFALILTMIIRYNKDKRLQLACVGVKVEFADDYRFVTQEDIEGYLQKDYGAYLGKRLDSLDLEKVENILNNKSAVLRTDAYTTPDGFLNVRIRQREPVVRFQKGSLGFFSDEKGFLFPLQSNYTSSVPVIDGNIPLDFAQGYKGEPKTETEQKWLGQVIELVRFMGSSAEWKNAISQIRVNENGDLVMIMREGAEHFIFGRPDNIKEKFSRMKKYYTAIVPEKGHYRTVNVKYKKQIICRENIR